MCAMRLFTQAEEQIEANVQRNDYIGSDDEDKDENDSGCCDWSPKRLERRIRERESPRIKLSQCSPMVSNIHR